MMISCNQQGAPRGALSLSPIIIYIFYNYYGSVEDFPSFYRSKIPHSSAIGRNLLHASPPATVASGSFIRCESSDLSYGESPLQAVNKWCVRGCWFCVDGTARGFTENPWHRLDLLQLPGTRGFSGLSCSHFSSNLSESELSTRFLT